MRRPHGSVASAIEMRSKAGILVNASNDQLVTRLETIRATLILRSGIQGTTFSIKR